MVLVRSTERSVTTWVLTVQKSKYLGPAARSVKLEGWLSLFRVLKTTLLILCLPVGRVY